MKIEKLNARQPIAVAILGFDGVSALDLTGPLETFAAARVDDVETERSRPYQVRLIGVTGKTKRDIRSETLFWLIR